MAHVSGNATWVDYPSTTTLVTAARLENIEGALDALGGSNGSVSVMVSDATPTTARNTTSTAYVPVSVPISLTFVAPASGKVLVEVSGSVAAGVTGNASTAAFDLRAGGTVGSGTQIVAPADSNAISTAATTGVEASRSTLVSGLTSNSTYNAQVMHKTSAGTGYLARGRLLVTPLAV